MSVFADFLDLQTAVNEQVGTVEFTDAMPRFVKMAESDFNRRLRTRSQYNAIGFTPTNGLRPLPDDFLEIIALADPAGVEQVAMGEAAFEQLTDKRGFYTVIGLAGQRFIKATDQAFALHYYQMIPTIATGSDGNNWLLQAHPMLYLYAVSQKVFERMRDAESALAMAQLVEREITRIMSADYDERLSRARVRVVGPTP